MSEAGQLSRTFERLRASGQAALIPFVMGGDQPLDELPVLLQALAEGGADAIEVGVPFSDPIADGPVIAAAAQRALDRGVSPAGLLAALATRQRRETPLVLMTYYNPVLAFGLERFASAAGEAGVAGVIVTDLVPEEGAAWAAAARQNGLDTIYLAAPTSTPERISLVCSAASGFVYAVSRTGVTGAGVEVPPEARDLVERIRGCTSLPVCVGFGISTPPQVAAVSGFADGAVVGSALVEWLAGNWGRSSSFEELRSWIGALKSATAR